MILKLKSPYMGDFKIKIQNHSCDLKIKAVNTVLGAPSFKVRTPCTLGFEVGDCGLLVAASRVSLSMDHF